MSLTIPIRYWYGNMLPDFSADGSVGGAVNFKSSWNASGPNSGTPPGGNGRNSLSGIQLRPQEWLCCRGRSRAWGCTGLESRPRMALVTWSWSTASARRCPLSPQIAQMPPCASRRARYSSWVSPYCRRGLSAQHLRTFPLRAFGAVRGAISPSPAASSGSRTFRHLADSIGPAGCCSLEFQAALIGTPIAVLLADLGSWPGSLGLAQPGTRDGLRGWAAVIALVVAGG